MTSSTTLPTTRPLLTSLINTLTLAQVINQPYSNVNDEPSNPLKAISAEQKKLLSTLHVLFPPPMLLLSLDLLDRGLVVRIIEADTFSATNPKNPLEGTVDPPQAHVHLPSPAAATAYEGSSPPWPSDEDGKQRRNEIYLVRSSQPPKSRITTTTTTTSAAGMTYVVRLKAWNCTCAAFAFSCFPGGDYSSPSSSSSKPWDVGESDDDEIVFSMRRLEGKEREEEDQDMSWEFGGLSLDGKGITGKNEDGGSVPVCKHLLACLLGERWEGVLGAYVKERVVSREEMAGYAAEG